MKRIVKFITRCGCSKIEEVEGPDQLQEFIDIPLASDITAKYFQENFHPIMVIRRPFQFREVLRVENQILFVYREVEIE